jgi:hypothetical protein
MARLSGAVTGAIGTDIGAAAIGTAAIRHHTKTAATRAAPAHRPVRIRAHARRL